MEDPWKKVKDTYKVGQVVEGEVHKIEPFGLMVKLDEDIHGLAHISELSNTQLKSIYELKDKFTLGHRYKFEIVNIEPEQHRLGLKAEGVKSRQEEKKPPEKSEKIEKPEEVVEVTMEK